MTFSTCLRHTLPRSPNHVARIYHVTLCVHVGEILVMSSPKLGGNDPVYPCGNGPVQLSDGDLSWSEVTEICRILSLTSDPGH